MPATGPSVSAEIGSGLNERETISSPWDVTSKLSLLPALPRSRLFAAGPSDIEIAPARPDRDRENSPSRPFDGDREGRPARAELGHALDAITAGVAMGLSGAGLSQSGIGAMTLASGEWARRGKGATQWPRVRRLEEQLALFKRMSHLAVAVCFLF
jgi:hypothetical protein